MRLVFDRVETSCRAGRVDVRVDVAGDSRDGITMTWSMFNDTELAATVESVAAVWRIVEARHPVRMFRHGYQSWSPSGWATFGIDEDPSRTPGAIALVVDMHSADCHPVDAGELRSELVTSLRDSGEDPPITIGFVGGSEHDGIWHLRTHDGHVEL